MAGKTRNTVLVKARRRADELAGKRREREEKLKALATEYLAETMTADQLVEEAQEAAAAMVAAAKMKAATGRERAKGTIVKMLATGEPRNGIAELLDVSVSFVRGVDIAAAKAAKASAETGVGSVTADEADGSEQQGGLGVVAAQ